MFLNCQNKWMESLRVEPSDGARTMAEEINQISIPSEILGSYQEQQFDIITMWHVLEHVHLLNETVEFLKDKSTQKER
jgi:2-polyprenyl-3-methyl-5-hydroxy-6-metoxy-1,4-benzoquinol methylase